MTDFMDRLVRLASTIKEAQVPDIVQPTAAGGGGPMMPSSEGGAGSPDGAMGATLPDAGADTPIPDMSVEPPADEEKPEEKKSEIEKPTSWIVKFHEGNFWIGRVFPEDYIDQAVSFFSQRKSVPKEQVRDYFEKMREGKKETPKEISEAPETELDAAVPPAGAEGTPEMPIGQDVAGGGKMEDEFLGAPPA